MKKEIVFNFILVQAVLLTSVLIFSKDLTGFVSILIVVSLIYLRRFR